MSAAGAAAGSVAGADGVGTEAEGTEAAGLADLPSRRSKKPMAVV